MKKDYLLWRYHFLKVFGVGFLLIVGFLQFVYTDQHDFVLVDSPKDFYEDELKANRYPIGIPGDDKPAVIFSQSYLRGNRLFLFATHEYQFGDSKLEEEIVLYTSLDQGETWSDRQVLPILGGEPCPSITKRGTILITTRLLAADVRNTLGYTHSYLYRSTDNLKTIEQIQINAEFFPQIMEGIPETVEDRLQTAQNRISLRREFLSAKANEDSKGVETIAEQEKPTIVDLEELSSPDELALENVRSQRRKRRIGTSRDLMKNVEGVETIAERGKPAIVDLEELSSPDELALENVRSQRRKRRIGTSRDLMELIGERESTVDFLPAGALQKWVLTSRNVLELTDGSLILGVSMPNGIDYLWKSFNEGKTWDTTMLCDFEGVDPNRVNHPFFGGGVFWQPTNRDLLVLIPVNSDLFPVENHQTLVTDLNQSERLVVFRSEDLGRNWRKESELGGDYGGMYPGLIRLHGGKLLLTFTLMDFKQPLDLWAIVGRERPFGFDFDFQYDRLILSRKTSEGKKNNAGFGSTQQIGDGKFITSYSYQGIDKKTHLEIVEWILPLVSRRSAGF